MKLVVKNEDVIDTTIGSNQSHCQEIETTQMWTVNIRYENMFGQSSSWLQSNIVKCTLFFSITEAAKKSNSSHGREHGNQ